MPATGAVGIIANPASGKDIRRLVAHGSVFDNNEKINIVRRVLSTLDSLNVPAAWYMPDTYGIVQRAAQPLKLTLDLQPLPMPVLANSGDSIEAAMRMRDLDVSCLITLGGDGTNRAVTRGCGDVPLIPISTGTNNVFPRMVEGTVAGMAAAVVALGCGDQAIERRPKLEVRIDGDFADIALVDVVLSSQSWIGSRAFWQADHVLEVVLSHIPRSAIGISALGAILVPENTSQKRGLHARLGTPGRQVLCPIAPGSLQTLSVAFAEIVDDGCSVHLGQHQGTLALDGERELELAPEQQSTVALSLEGPRVIDLEQAITLGAVAGLFTR